MFSSNRVKYALITSFMISFLSLGVKMAAYLFTDAVTAFSDTAESIVHVLAVGFVLYGYYLSQKPADDDHLYGHERIEFLSIGIEGVVIILAAFTILFLAVQNLITGHEINELGLGMILMAIAAIINLILGSYVLKVGREEKNMMAVSNGKHVLTDVWTSGGVILTLFLISVTGWVILDTAVSLAIAGYIFFEGFKLVRYSINGIMDARDPDVHKALLEILGNDLPGSIENWHHLRHRTSGQTTWVELHLTFEKTVTLKQAHDDATQLERKLIDALESDAVVTLHLEPEEPHKEIHNVLKGANKNRPLDDFI
ncbi:MAG: cation diffusion facilitator family transporter [Balneolaceae bacterium]